MENTGLKMQEMIHDIRTYLGYNASMTRIINGKQVFITPDCINATWNAVNAKKGIISVENTLYLN